MNVKLSLTGELAAYVESKVSSGLYASSSEVVQEALRLMEQQDKAKLAWLRKSFQDGLDSGDAGEMDWEALKAEGRERLSGEKA